VGAVADLQTNLAMADIRVSTATESQPVPIVEMSTAQVQKSQPTRSMHQGEAAAAAEPQSGTSVVASCACRSPPPKATARLCPFSNVLACQRLSFL